MCQGIAGNEDKHRGCCARGRYRRVEAARSRGDSGVGETTVKDLRVADVMTRQVVTVHRNDPFKNLVRLMSEHEVSGLPVIDDDRRLIGLVSEADLLRAWEEDRQPRPRSLFLEWFIDRRRLEEIDAAIPDVRAEDVMTREVITAAPETPVEEAIAVLLRHGIRRLPVIDGDKRVVGIASRRDFLSPFLRTDDDLHREVQEEVIYRTMWLDPTSVDVGVRDGVVRLRGTVDRRSTKDIMVELVRRVDGVVGVEDDELAFREDDRRHVPPPFVSPDVIGDSPEGPGYASRS
jgi:CBS domain-containing protein